MLRSSCFRWLGLRSLYMFLGILGGCSTVRTTTTLRTAVEQALLSQAVEASVEQIKTPAISGKSYVLRKDYLSAVDSEFIMGTLSRRLLEQGGMHIDDEKSTATELVIYPVVAHNGIDDSSILIGLPDIPLIMPGVGAVTIPETAFYKHVCQVAGNRLWLMGKERKSGKLVFATDPVCSQRKYERWVFLFVFHFHTTDLKSPH